MDIIAILVEELGELAREINHCFGPKKKKSTEQTKEIGDEIADVIFSLTCLANSLNINLEECLQKNIEKKTQKRRLAF